MADSAMEELENCTAVGLFRLAVAKNIEIRQNSTLHQRITHMRFVSSLGYRLRDMDLVRFELVQEEEVPVCVRPTRPIRRVNRRRVLVVPTREEDRAPVRQHNNFFDVIPEVKKVFKVPNILKRSYGVNRNPASRPSVARPVEPVPTYQDPPVEVKKVFKIPNILKRAYGITKRTITNW